VYYSFDKVNLTKPVTDSRQGTLAEHTKGIAYQEYIKQEDKDRRNPANILIRVLIICLNGFFDSVRPKIIPVTTDERPDAGYREAEDWHDRKRMFALCIDKKTTALKLKERIYQEFKLPTLRVYFQNFEIEDGI